MASSQVYKTPKRKCSRCLYDSQLTEKCSARLWPPAGGHLCPDCLVPAAIEAQARVNAEDAVCEHNIPLRVVCVDCQPDRVLAEPEGRVRSDNADPYLTRMNKARDKQQHKKKPPADPVSITCPECGMTSFNKNDIQQGYCGACSWWTSDPVMSLVPKEERGS